ncbi:unnamed protein product [[Candida] boidinii]|nr:unnamed protein product [[Candida] boidinii]
MITRSLLEIGALTSINLLKPLEFSNYITQVKSFYELNDILPISKNQNKLISLYLLLLLTQDNLALFHIELEKFKNFGLNVDDLETDEYLSIPIKFEKWIIDGNFNKVYDILSSKHKYPCKEFNLFEKDLLDSIRFTISTNIESSYDSLPIENLKLLLFLKNSNDINEYIEKMNWLVENNVVHFNKSLTNTNAMVDDDDEILEAKDERIIIKNVIGYGKEMENIV